MSFAFWFHLQIIDIGIWTLQMRKIPNANYSSNTFSRHDLLQKLNGILVVSNNSDYIITTRKSNAICNDRYKELM